MDKGREEREEVRGQGRTIETMKEQEEPKDESATIVGDHTFFFIIEKKRGETW